MRKIILAALAATALAGQAVAENVTMDTMVGTTASEARTTLTKMGYDVRKSELEDGQIELYIVKGDEKAELYVSPTTGKPTKIKVK